MQQILLLVVVLALLICPVISFRYCAKKFKNDGISKLRAFFYFLLITSLPITLYIALNLILVGIEELTGKAIITEGIARSFIIVIGFGLLLILNLSVIFIVYLRKLERNKQI